MKDPFISPPVDVTHYENTHYAEKRRQFARFYAGWRDFKAGNPIEPHPQWSPQSKENYYDGAEAAKNQRDEGISG